jgi:hypothetical protein
MLRYTSPVPVRRKRDEDRDRIRTASDTGIAPQAAQVSPTSVLRKTSPCAVAVQYVVPATCAKPAKSAATGAAIGSNDARAGSGGRDGASLKVVVAR